MLAATGAAEGAMGVIEKLVSSCHLSLPGKALRLEHRVLQWRLYMATCRLEICAFEDVRCCEL